MPRVLVVEDESDLVWLMRYNLEREGYETFVAPNGQAALELVREQRPGLLLLDIMMPLVDGWSVLEDLNASGERPKVIVVTAKTSSGDRARAEKLGVDAFVTKPFDMDELLALIRNLLPPAANGDATPQ